nr:MAG TPA: hypothetical protein [Caudoviricetes sp.]
MSELQNENTTEVVVSEDVNETPATEVTKDDSLGKIGIALIGLAAVGTYTLGKAAVKGGMKLVEKAKEKRADLKRAKDAKDADYCEADDEDVIDEADQDDETENEK